MKANNLNFAILKNVRFFLADFGNGVGSMLWAPAVTAARKAPHDAASTLASVKRARVCQGLYSSLTAFGSQRALYQV